MQVPKLQYPETRKASDVGDYFGTRGSGPVSLDGGSRLERKWPTWVAAQNAVTFGYLGNAADARSTSSSASPSSGTIRRSACPVREGGRYFYSKNSGLQRQAPLYVRALSSRTPSLVIDPNAAVA